MDVPCQVGTTCHHHPGNRGQPQGPRLCLAGQSGERGLWAGPCIPPLLEVTFIQEDPELVLLKERRNCRRQVGMGQT